VYVEHLEVFLWCWLLLMIFDDVEDGLDYVKEDLEDENWLLKSNDAESDNSVCYHRNRSFIHVCHHSKVD